MRLRPTGKSGSLVLPLAEFRRYFDGGGAPAVGAAVADPGAGGPRRAGVRRRGDGRGARRRCSASRGAPALVDEVRAMRDEAGGDRQPAEPEARPRRDRRTSSSWCSCFQLKYGRDRPDVLRPNVWDALDALRGRRAAAAGRRGRAAGRVLVPAAGRGPAADRHRPAADGGARRRRRPGEAGPPARVRGGGAVRRRVARVTAEVRRLFRAVTEREQIVSLRSRDRQASGFNDRKPAPWRSRLLPNRSLSTKLRQVPLSAQVDPFRCDPLRLPGPGRSPWSAAPTRGVPRPAPVAQAGTTPPRRRTATASAAPTCSKSPSPTGRSGTASPSVELDGRLPLGEPGNPRVEGLTVDEMRRPRPAG